MKPLRLVAGAVIWLLAGLLASVGLLLCVTVVLLPVGVPLLMVARRLFGLSARLVLPRAAVHPVRELEKRTVGRGTRAIERGREALATRTRRRPPTLRERVGKRLRRVRKRLRSS